MIDYEAINETLTIPKVKRILEQLSIPYKDKGQYLIMPTVCHNYDINEASWKLYYYENNHLFVCYTEDGNMSIWKFLKHYYECRDIEYNWYRDIYCVITDGTQPEGFTTPQYKSLRNNYDTRRNIELPTFPSGVLDCFVKKYPPEWLADGISREAMDKYNIRYSISQNKIIIPHYAAATGLLIGIRGRALNQYEIENFGKYMPVQIEGRWYSHQLSMNLYGLYQNKENIKKSGIVYLAEGEKSVLQAESFSEPNCVVAVCGSQFNKYQLRLLMELCQPTEIVICFDKEEKPGEENYFNKLWNLCDRYKNYANFSFIYDRQGLLEMKDSPTDKGEEIFKKLLQKRGRVR